MKRVPIVIALMLVTFTITTNFAQMPDDERDTPKGPRRIYPVIERGVLRAPPVNDNFASATVIGSIPYTDTAGSFDEATGESGEPLDCLSDTASIWYSLTPGSAGVITLDTEGSTFDTVLAVYTGAAVNALTMLRCNDDFSVVEDAGLTSTITGLSVSSGVTYMIRVSAYDNGLLVSGDESVLNIGFTPAAGSFTVNSTADAVDANIGNGTCLTAGGVCTLRAAINEANASQPGSTITIPAGTYTITINAPVNPSNPSSRLYEDAAINGDLDIVTGVTITGGGAQATIIDGGDLDSVLELFAGADVTLSGVTIRNGRRPGSQSAGGGIRMNETAVLNANSIIVTSNEAVFGGGLTVEGGMLVMTNSAITANSATGRTFVNDPPPNTYIPGAGGGLEVRENLGENVSISLTNVTISGNTAIAPDASVTSEGGGLFFGVPLANLEVDLNNVTIAANSASRGGGVFSDALNASANVDVVFNNTLIGNNTAPTNPDCKGELGSTGFNLIGNATGCTVHASDRVNQNPFISNLALNAPGTTPTHMLQAASAARNNGHGATCAATDQRGIARPQGAGCDIGALEALTTAPGAFNPISPSNGQVIESSTGLTQLTWTVSSNALTYTLVIDNITGGTTVNVYTATVNASSVCAATCVSAFSQPLADGFYRFSLSARADTLVTNASTSHTFQVDSVLSLPNLVENPGFETGPGLPAGWKGTNLTKDKRKCNTVTVTVAHEGTCAFMFKSSAKEASAIKQKLDLSGIVFATGDTFRLTFYAAPAATTAAKAQLKITYTKLSIPASKVKFNLPTGDKTYKPFLAEVSLTDPRVAKAVLKFSNQSTSGKWYLDTVRVVYIVAAPRDMRADGVLPPPPPPAGFRGRN